MVAQQSQTMVTTTRKRTSMSSHCGMPDWREMQSSQLEDIVVGSSGLVAAAWSLPLALSTGVGSGVRTAAVDVSGSDCSSSESPGKSTGTRFKRLKVGLVGTRA